jgi:mRNA interferase HicA
MKVADLHRHLRTHSCELHREGSKHSIWRNRANQKITSVPRHREVKDTTARAICRQLEIPLP